MTSTIESGDATTGDGTRIAWRSVGSGAPLLIVHGAANAGADYGPLAQRLASGYRAITFDRRGYGESEAGLRPATFEQDGADIRVLLEMLGPETFLFGHSAGALAAMHAARSTPVRGLALYEPPLLVSRPAVGEAQRTVRAARAAGRPGAALAAFIAAAMAGDDEGPLGAMTPEQLAAAIEQAPELRPRLAWLDGVERDIESVLALPPDPEPWRELTTPTLLVLGGASTGYAADGIRALAGTLPDARTLVLPGQAHIAHQDAPDLLAEALEGFFVV